MPAMSPRPRSILVTLVSVFAFLLVARVVFGVWVTHRVRAALVDLGEETGTFRDASISILAPSMTVTDLRITERAKPDREPVVHARVATADYTWGEILRGKPVLRFSGTNVKFAIYSGGGKKSDLDIADIEHSLDEGVPGVIDGMKLRDSEILVVDLNGKKPKQVWIHGVDADLTGLSERGWERADATIRFSGHGTLQHSGAMRLDVTAVNDVPAGTVSVKGKGSIGHFVLADAYAYISEACGLSVHKGSMSLAIDFETDLRNFEGRMDADYRGIAIAPADGGILNQIKEAALEVKLSAKSSGEDGHDFEGRSTIRTTGEPEDAYLDNLIDFFHATFSRAIAGALGAG